MKLIDKEELITEEDLSENRRDWGRNISEKQRNCGRHIGYDTVYQGEFIKRCVMNILDNVEVVGHRFGSKNQRQIDFIWDIDGHKFKIKHIYSCLNRRLYKIKNWRYYIKYNDHVDIFILTAFNNIESLELQHFWVIKAKEKFPSQRSEDKEFWNRSVYFIYDTKKGISKMEKYEHKDKLEKLKDLILKIKENKKMERL